MDSGSGLDPDTGNKGKGSGGGNGERKFGAFMKRVEPFLPRKDLNPRDLRSWAKKTGFVSDYSGETSTYTRTKFGESSDFDLQNGRDQTVPGSDPILRRSRPEIERVTGFEPGSGSGSREEEERRLNRNEATSETENEGGIFNKDLENGFYYPGGGERESSEDGQWPKPIVMKFGLRDNPGFG